MRPAAKLILYGQIFFYGSLIVCVALKPAGLGTNNGISYYGVYRDTFFPYSVGLLGAAYFAVRAVAQLSADADRPLRLALQAYAPLIVGIVITPYAAGQWMDYLHHACGTVLFSLQLLLSGWLVRKLSYAWWAVMLMVLEFLAGLLCALYLMPSHGFLLQFQVVFQLAFGTLLFLSLATMPTRQVAEPQASRVAAPSEMPGSK